MKNDFEADFLKEWCVTILNYFKLAFPDNLDATNRFEKIVIDTFNMKDLRGLRHLKNDLSEWSKGLAIGDQTNLNKELSEKFGSNVDSEISKVIFKTVFKRKILSDLECEVINNYINEHINTTRQTEIVRLLNRYLIDFENKKRS